ncbi:MAG TPA: HAD family phosphatase [Allosphingosinicella sp.]|jgi:HAD superfamily hydrolase (TIGR01509 family)
MRGVRALLVDLDGTLVDTAGANYAAYAQALKGVGVQISRVEFERVAFGRSWRQFLPPLLGNAAACEAVAAEKARIYPDFLGETVLNTALARLIEAGRPGWATALVTTASRVSAQAVLRHHRVETLFDTVVTGNDVTRHKPDPEAYRVAAGRLGAAPAECLAFEDSDIGEAAARAFGAACIRIAFDGRGLSAGSRPAGA